MSSSPFNRPVHPAAPHLRSGNIPTLVPSDPLNLPFRRHLTAAAITLPAFNPHRLAPTVQSN